MKAAERILRNEIVQKFRTIKLVNHSNVVIDSPEVFSAVPDPELGTVRFNGKDVVVKIYATESSIEYYAVVDGHKPELLLRHNVHETVEMNLKSITRSLDSLIRSTQID